MFSEAFDVLEDEIFLESIEDFFGDAGVDFNGVKFNGIGVVLGDFFYLYTAFGGGNDGWSLGVPIENKSKIYLSNDVHSFMDEDCVDLKTVLGGLDGRQVVADHSLSEVFDLLWGFDDLNTAFESTA